ncbi:4Fe-4S ferredoxin N-terminal domain-containing protein [Natrinema pallidum]|uniref:4Fe-4S ferredoxin iron-sulfur binding domain-containing protein n=2 Tax=Natrinema pallidum TaxID=69527 RepID=L9YMD5_9EURY|nr:4Fe-4S ferredoxin N-terminal domain-containing protein [Natrinema pallidum]ELY74831.1 hypothetical protein C487_14304 [Natrinema pallidum DSM 3751]QCW04433.1 hypothetical protein FGF80_14850 [Natrinema pallidum]
MGNSDETRMIDDESVGIDAAVWEETADELLADSPYDPKLGKEMSRDAVRVSTGRMTEAEFHEKYHDAVLEEFGVDDRPIETGDADE